MYKLIGKDGKEYLSEQNGQFGGHRKLKIYGKLDCPSALRYIAAGHYVQHRVFFADEETALATGYRPCGGLHEGALQSLERWQTYDFMA